MPSAPSALPPSKGRRLAVEDHRAHSPWMQVVQLGTPYKPRRSPHLQGPEHTELVVFPDGDLMQYHVLLPDGAAASRAVSLSDGLRCRPQIHRELA